MAQLGHKNGRLSAEANHPPPLTRTFGNDGFAARRRRTQEQSSRDSPSDLTVYHCQRTLSRASPYGVACVPSGSESKNSPQGRNCVHSNSLHITARSFVHFSPDSPTQFAVSYYFNLLHYISVPIGSMILAQSYKKRTFFA